jgi:DNA-binding NarL/FixJ family response regulator
MHKKIKINLDNNTINSDTNNQISNVKSSSSNKNIDRENRLSSVITLHSKGFTQYEIAKQLQVDQSTVSRDLQIIKNEARINIEKYTK